MARWYGLLSLWLQAHLTHDGYQEIFLIVAARGDRRRRLCMDARVWQCRAHQRFLWRYCFSWLWASNRTQTNWQRGMLFTSDPKVLTSHTLCYALLTVCRHCNIYLIHPVISLVNLLKTARPLYSPPVKALVGPKVVLIVVGNVYHLTVHLRRDATCPPQENHEPSIFLRRSQGVSSCISRHCAVRNSPSVNKYLTLTHL